MRALAEELSQDSELAALRLYDFLGTPEGGVIRAAVELAIPQPYRLIVQEALMLVGREQGAGRRQLAAFLVVGAATATFLGLIAAASE